jgi:hypothetical protein
MNLKDYEKIFFFQILIQRRNMITIDAIASCGWSLKINKKLTNISCIVEYVIKNEYKHLRSLVQMLIGLVVM